MPDTTCCWYRCLPHTPYTILLPLQGDPIPVQGGLQYSVIVDRYLHHILPPNSGPIHHTATSARWPNCTRWPTILTHSGPIPAPYAVIMAPYTILLPLQGDPIPVPYAATYRLKLLEMYICWTLSIRLMGNSKQLRGTRAMHVTHATMKQILQVDFAIIGWHWSNSPYHHPPPPTSFQNVLCSVNTKVCVAANLITIPWFILVPLPGPFCSL